MLGIDNFVANQPQPQVSYTDQPQQLQQRVNEALELVGDANRRRAHVPQWCNTNRVGQVDELSPEDVNFYAPSADADSGIEQKHRNDEGFEELQYGLRWTQRVVGAELTRRIAAAFDNKAFQKFFFVIVSAPDRVALRNQTQDRLCEFW